MNRAMGAAPLERHASMAVLSMARKARDTLTGFEMTPTTGRASAALGAGMYGGGVYVTYPDAIRTSGSVYKACASSGHWHGSPMKPSKLRRPVVNACPPTHL